MELKACPRSHSYPAAQNLSRFFFSSLSRRFYASRAYKQEGDLFTITGEKFDMTNDIAELVLRTG